MRLVVTEDLLLSKYKIKLSELYSLSACRKEFQVGGSYCALGKLACCALQTRQITTSPTFSTYGTGEMPKPVLDFFAKLRSMIGDRYDEIVATNDSERGFFQDNHERALRMAIQAAVECGLVEIEDEDSELMRKLKEQLNGRVLPDQLPDQRPQDCAA